MGWSPWPGCFILNQEVDTGPCECPGDSSVPVPSAETGSSVAAFRSGGQYQARGGLSRGMYPLRFSRGWLHPISLATQSRLGAFLWTSQAAPGADGMRPGPGVRGQVCPRLPTLGHGEESNGLCLSFLPEPWKLEGKELCLSKCAGTPGGTLPKRSQTTLPILLCLPLCNVGL